jgi:hypothetical protein
MLCWRQVCFGFENEILSFAKKKKKKKKAKKAKKTKFLNNV